MQEKKCGFRMNDRIKHIRNKLGYTQGQFASLLKCDQAAISRLEQGKKALDVDAMCILHEKCNININWLVTGEGSLTLAKNKAGDSQEHVADAELQDLKEWLMEQSEEEPEIWAWFRVQLKKKFPDYREWFKKRHAAASEAVM